MATSEIEALTKAINSLLQLQLQRERPQETNPRPTTTSTETFNQLSTRIEKYVFASGDEIRPFSKWLLRHVYSLVTESLPAEMRTRLLLDKLGQTEFDRLVDHVASADPTKIKQEDLITILKNLFRDKISLTCRRIEILNYRYDKTVPIPEHIDRINCLASDFERTKLTDDNLRILLLLQSLCYSHENDDQKKIALSVVEKNPDASLKDIAAELEAFTNISENMKTLENPTSTSMEISHAVRIKPKIKKHFPLKTTKQYEEIDSTAKKSSGPSKCNGCDGLHF